MNDNHGRHNSSGSGVRATVDESIRTVLMRQESAARKWAVDQIVSTETGRRAIADGWVRELANQARQSHLVAVRSGRTPPTLADIAAKASAVLKQRSSHPRLDAICVLGVQHTDLIDREMARGGRP